MTRPRNVAGPVVRGSDFWGREPEMAELSLLVSRGSVLLAGPRRHGKSSLMYGLVDRPPAGSTVILLDVEWVETPDEFLTTIAAELLALQPVRRLLATARRIPSALARWTKGVVGEVGVGLDNVGEIKVHLREHRDTTEWPELAEQTLGILRELPDRVVLILDEFPTMISNMLDRDEPGALRFLRWFRTFRQSTGTDNLSFLLGGSTNIEPRLEALRAEILLGDLQRFRILPFSPAKALEFVIALLDEESVPYLEGTAEEIARATGSGVPYYLQVVVAECLSEARRTASTLAPADVEQLYRERVIGPVNRHRFSHYHTRLKSHYGLLETSARVVLQSLCDRPHSIEELSDALTTAGCNPGELDRVLVLLEGDYYISRDRESVSFSDGLLRDWWARNSLAPLGRLQ